MDTYAISVALILTEKVDTACTGYRSLANQTYKSLGNLCSVSLSSAWLVVAHHD
jgi:hypothetical protein